MKDLIRQMFRKLTPREMAARELSEAERNKLEAQTAVEYAQSVVSYNDNRIRRLRRYLSDEEASA